MLCGTLVGLITCLSTAIVLRRYALARLAEQSEAGERFAVNMDIFGFGSLVLLGSLIITLIVAVLGRRRMRRIQSEHIRWIVLAFALTVAAGLVVNGGADNGFYLALVAVWVVLHGFGAASAR